MKLILVLLVLLLISCFVLAGCSSGTSSNNTASGASSSTTPVSNNPTSIANPVIIEGDVVGISGDVAGTQFDVTIESGDKTYYCHATADSSTSVFGRPIREVNDLSFLNKTHVRASLVGLRRGQTDKQYYGDLVQLTPKPPSLDEEGTKLGKKYFEDQLAQCGDSYYTKIENHNLPPAEAASLRNYAQYRNVTFTLDVEPVSDINRMNGLEWDGRVTMSWTYMRTAYGFAKPLRWALWQPKGANLIFVKKLKSGWKLEGQPLGGEKPTCQEVERIPEGQ